MAYLILWQSGRAAFCLSAVGIFKPPPPANRAATDRCVAIYFAVITDSLVIPAFSMEAIARATSP